MKNNAESHKRYTADMRLISFIFMVGINSTG
jgi:hypothetical protein